MKTYKFFYHYNKHTGKMTIHFRKKCVPVDDIDCNVPCETKWKETQPRLVMQGFASNVNIINNKAHIT